MTEDRPYPSTICRTCGINHGRRHTGIATWYPGICGVCGSITHVTEPRDFGHLNTSWKDEPYVERRVIDDTFN
jgi:hypothetical protein